MCVYIYIYIYTHMGKYKYIYIYMYISQRREKSESAISLQALRGFCSFRRWNANLQIIIIIIQSLCDSWESRQRGRLRSQSPASRLDRDKRYTVLYYAILYYTIPYYNMGFHRRATNSLHVVICWFKCTHVATFCYTFCPHFPVKVH